MIWYNRKINNRVYSTMTSAPNINEIPTSVTNVPEWLSKDFAMKLRGLFLKGEPFDRKTFVGNDIVYFRKGHSDEFKVGIEGDDLRVRVTSELSSRLAAFFGTYPGVNCNNPFGIAAAKAASVAVLAAYLDVDLSTGVENVSLASLNVIPGRSHEAVSLKPEDIDSAEYVHQILVEMRSSSLLSHGTMIDNSSNNNDNNTFLASLEANKPRLASFVSKHIIQGTSHHAPNPDEKLACLNDFFKRPDVEKLLLNWAKGSKAPKALFNKVLYGLIDQHKNAQAKSQAANQIVTELKTLRTASAGGGPLSPAQQAAAAFRKSNRDRVTAQDLEELRREEEQKATFRGLNASTQQGFDNVETQLTPFGLPQVFRNSSILYVIRNDNKNSHFSVFVIDLQLCNIVCLDTASRATAGAALSTHADVRDFLTRTFRSALPPNKHAEVLPCLSHFSLCYPAIEWQQQPVAGTNTCVPFAFYLMSLYHVDMQSIRAVSKANAEPFASAGTDNVKQTSLNGDWGRYKLTHAQVSRFIHHLLGTDALVTA